MSYVSVIVFVNAVILILILLLFYYKKFSKDYRSVIQANFVYFPSTTLRCENSANNRSSSSQEDTNSIFNISSNVEDRPSQTLTSDAFVSIQHINTVNQMNNKSAQNDEPPSYEEAIKMSNNGQPPAFTSIIITAPSQDERNHPPSPVPIHSSTTH